MNENTEKIKDDIKSALNETKEKGRKQIEIARKNMEEKRKQMRKYVHENPEKSLLIAAGVGAAAALTLIVLMRAGKNSCS